MISAQCLVLTAAAHAMPHATPEVPTQPSRVGREGEEAATLGEDTALDLQKTPSYSACHSGCHCHTDSLDIPYPPSL